jgi:hypothetical protein
VCCCDLCRKGVIRLEDVVNFAGTEEIQRILSETRGPQSFQEVIAVLQQHPSATFNFLEFVCAVMPK